MISYFERRKTVSNSFIIWASKIGNESPQLKFNLRDWCVSITHDVQIVQFFEVKKRNYNHIKLNLIVDFLFLLLFSYFFVSSFALSHEKSTFNSNSVHLILFWREEKKQHKNRRYLGRRECANWPIAECMRFEIKTLEKSMCNVSFEKINCAYVRLNKIYDKMYVVRMKR